LNVKLNVFQSITPFKTNIKVFMEYMKNSFHSYLPWFVVVYKDDILVYYESYAEHAGRCAVDFKGKDVVC